MSAKVLIRPISFYFIQDDGGMFKLNISPTSVLHPKIAIRCHHLTLLYQEFGTETAVEEWLAINTKVHYHARLMARKISSCQTISRDTIGWTFIFCFHIGLIIPIGIFLKASSTTAISFRERDFGNPIIDVHGYDVRYYLSVAMMRFRT